MIMNLFSKKTNVAKMEEDFNTKTMENQKIYHELNIRSSDPELLRTQVLEIVEDMGYSVYINKFTKFQDSEFNNIFDQGRLKPLRAVLKAEKKIETGSKFPGLWKFMALTSFMFFLLSIVPDSLWNIINLTVNSNYFLIISFIFVIITLLIYITRKLDSLTIWFKASGIYNITEESSDFKAIFCAQSSSKNRKIIKKLNDEVSQLFSIISRKYVKNKSKDNKIIKLSKKNKDSVVNVIKSINSVERDLKKLDSRLARGEITERVYNEVKENLKERKIKLETIIDLINYE